MSILKKCIDCDIIIVDEWFFPCSGYLCNKVIDYKCAAANATKMLKKFPTDLRKGMKLVMDDVPGLRWFCSNCECGLNNMLSKFDELLKHIDKSNETKFDSILKRMEKLETILTTGVLGLSHSSSQLEDRRVTRSMSKTFSQTESHCPVNTHSNISSLTRPSVCQQRQLIITPAPNDGAMKIPSIPTQPILPTSDDKVAPNDAAFSCEYSLRQQRQLNKSDTPAHFNDVSKASKIPMQPNIAACSTNPTQSAVAIPKLNPTPTLIESTDEYLIRVARPRKWLFVSRIHYSVSDEQFRKLLTKTVNTDDIFVQRIVPKSTTGLKYDYVSYKINMPEEVFQSTINSKQWPEGLLVKEFDWSQKKAFFQTPQSRHRIQ